MTLTILHRVMLSKSCSKRLLIVLSIWLLPNRQDKKFEICYRSVKDSFKSIPLCLLGLADHNCVHPLPIYKTVLKRQKKKKTQMKDIKDLTEKPVLSLLQGCCECTRWQMFEQSCNGRDKLVDTTCSCVAFQTHIIPKQEE